MRNEHLSDEEVRKREEKQKKMKEKINSHHLKKSKSKSKNNNNSDIDSLGQDLNEVNIEEDGAEYYGDDLDDEFNIEHRPSLPPPPKTGVSWNEYITAEESRWPNLGRKVRIKESKKEFKAQLAMVLISSNLSLFVNSL